MPELFTSFVVFAEMRTGSNFLESNLNALPGVACHGEAFNPHFIGYPNKTEILGVTHEMREADPIGLLDTIRAQPGVLGGFRYFHDHDPRILDVILDDPQVAKIILTRNPLDSYVSWKIAKSTGQWKLTNVKRRKEAKAIFDAEEFGQHVQELQAFQVLLLNRLQRSGQSAFYVAYEDLQDLDVMNGLAKWLGLPARLEALDDKLKRQNPAPVSSKVENAEEMELALAGLDRFNLTRTPNFEPRRGPAVPGYIAAAEAPLLYMPIAGGLEPELIQWLAALDGIGADALRMKMNQKQLRQWRRATPVHRSFSVVRHPLARAHAVFCDRILSKGPGSLRQIRNTLRRRYNLAIPEQPVDETYDMEQHRLAFAQFLAFVKSNLAGQTSIRVDANWASQSQILAGFAELAAPDLILREEELAQDLAWLAAKLGCANAPTFARPAADQPYALADIYDAELEELCRSAYQRDYLTFGFDDWQETR
ncbi:sulfotransferase family 2 domain-containing protein [Phaeobacter sp. HF9A]|uniref:sulfotransferase family 2 domain-containing protein n=1 Tax=Phaeobacter sp. HF9A TaxID=2721561 RepID=UPI001430D24E|nr:sulfotransferase family 2 domain-containing protein [Phaeobacter sp. HF9A]NIZ12190.1 sulfotransferase domain-containing protein [Phaeobacter sp. HF9A]